MKMLILGAALALMTLPAAAQNAAPAPAQTGYNSPAPEWVDIHMERPVDRPAALVWSRVGGYCQIELWFGTKCALTSGTGDVGTIRQLNGTLNELMVAKSPLSYGYSQPASPIYVHGNMSVEVVDSGHSKIVYDVLYDAAPLKTPEAKQAEFNRRKTRFEAGIDKMVQLSDAP